MARRIVEPTEMPLASPGTASFTETNKVKITGESSSDDNESEIVIHGDTYGLEEKARVLKFMEEPVTIMIHETTDPNAEHTVFLAVNGEGGGPHKTPWVPRGVPVTLARKFINVLCRARTEAIGNIEIVNATGEKEIKYPKSNALRYPFSVISDPNPRGAAWIAKQLSTR